MPILNKDKIEKFYSDIISIDNFKNGVVNTNNFILKDQNSLLDCLNLDIDNNGKLRTRKGYKKLYSGNVKNLFNFNGILYFTEGDYFKKLNSDNTSTPLLLLDGNKEISYTIINNELYFSNTDILKVVRSSGVIEDLTIESPKVKPIYSIVSNGSLKKGRYLIAFTYTRNGYEYGSSLMDVVELTEDNRGILLDAPSKYGFTISYYVSPLNSQTLYKTNNYLILTDQYLGNAIQTLNLDSIPNGSQILYFFGRLFSVVNNTLFYSMPNYYALCDLSSSFITIDNTKIIMIANVDDGLYISTELKTYFLQGTDPEKFNLVEILPYPAIKGTKFLNPNYKIKGWFSEKGLILADNGGQVKNITEEKFIPNVGYSSGIAFEKKQNGLDNVVVILDKVGDNNIYQTSDFIDNL